MITFIKQADLHSYLSSICATDTTIGFVPTMGALHAGHLSLMQQSLIENTITVVSIFVNPTQFNNPLDLEKYPRTLENDLDKIKNLSSEIIVFAPDVNDLYENKVVSQHFEFDGLENQMEGKKRPGHFDGVGTIVKKLFDIVQPTNAYFGEKDFQQLQIIKKMVQKNHLKVAVVGCPVFRESNGLAMSSRNERLSANDRNAAAIIFKTMKLAKVMFKSKSARTISEMVENHFAAQQLFRLEYFEIADENQLLPCVHKSKLKQYRGFIAVFCGDIRLIDTLAF